MDDGGSDVERTGRVRKRRGPVANVALVLLGIAALLLILPKFLGPYNRMRRSVEWQVGYQRFHKWGMETLETVRSLGRAYPRVSDLEDTPDDILRIIGECRLEGGEMSLLVACGGGFYHWGFKIGEPGWVPGPSMTSTSEELATGVWGWYER